MAENYGERVVINVKTGETHRESVLENPEQRTVEQIAMGDWEQKIAKTDSGMPRYLEDHIKDDHDGVAGNEFLQAKYDEKKLLRSEKP
jgi:hypothetical protein